MLGFSILVFVVISLLTGAFSGEPAKKTAAEQTPTSSTDTPNTSPTPSTPSEPEEYNNEETEPYPEGNTTPEEQNEPEVQPSEPEKIVSLNKSSLSLTVGDSSQLIATITPEDQNDDIVWSSNNWSVAQVKEGAVTAVAEGKAEITVTVNSEFSASCTIEVKKKSTEPETIAPTKITLDKSSVSLSIGKTSTIKATVLPDNATNKTVTWSSANARIATVSGGKITAVSAGSTTITAKTYNGKSATVKVTVIKPVAATGIKINTQGASIKVGKIYTLTATVLPSNATDKTVTWSSSNKSVATVSSKGVVTGKSSGFATITAKTHNGKTASVIISVVAN